MAVCYNKLWKLLIDRKMKKKELLELSGISKAALYKLTKDENVNTEMPTRQMFKRSFVNGFRKRHQSSDQKLYVNC